MKIRHLLLLMSIFVLLVGCTIANSEEEKPTDKPIIDNEVENDDHDINEQENDNHVDENEPGQNNENNEASVLDNADPSIIQLVNKENELGPDDHPTDLVTINVPYVLENPEIKQLREVAANALEEMFAAAKEDNIILFARSGFRSYQTQEQLFQNYADKNGLDAANRFSAKPGQSEHQTGLVMDVTSESVNLTLTEDFGETKEGKWVAEHAHQFGFIIRYPKDMEDITGYIYEPWHLRYLGVDVATAVFESNLTYEEFLEVERSGN